MYKISFKNIILKRVLKCTRFLFNNIIVKRVHTCKNAFVIISY